MGSVSMFQHKEHQVSQQSLGMTRGHELSPEPGLGEAAPAPASPQWEQAAGGSARSVIKKRSLRHKTSISQRAGQLHMRVIYLWFPEEELKLIFVDAESRVLD